MVEGNYSVDVSVQYPAALRGSAEAIGAITIPAASGARVPLAQLAQIRLEAGPVQVNREKAQRLVIVQANVRGRDLGGFAQEVRSTLDSRLTLPPGVFLTYGGEFENQARAMARLRVVVPISIALITVLLYLSLRSWSLASLVLVNLRGCGWGAGPVAPWSPPERVGLNRVYRAVRGGRAERPGAAHDDPTAAGRRPVGY